MSIAAIALSVLGASRPEWSPVSSVASIVLEPVRATPTPAVVLDTVVVIARKSADSDSNGTGAVYAPGSRAAIPPLAEEMRLVVNLPAFRLDVYHEGLLVRTYPVTIGASGFETPVGKYAIGDIIFNPWWHPPASEWAVGKSPVAPGPQNPMGRAKLNFAPLLYIHGSPNEEALGSAGSHGCVRLGNEDIIELSRIIQEFAAPDAGAIVDPLVADPGRTHQLMLGRRILLEIRYDLVEVRDGELVTHPDVYGMRDGLVATGVAAQSRQVR